MRAPAVAASIRVRPARAGTEHHVGALAHHDRHCGSRGTCVPEAGFVRMTWPAGTASLNASARGARASRP